MSEISATELRTIDLFSQLNERQFASIVSTMRVRELREKELLFARGERAERFFWLRAGQIKLFSLSPDGNERVVEIVRSGQTLAEPIMFLKKPEYPTFADALEPCTVVSFDNSTFLHILQDSSATCFRLLGTLSHYLHMRLNEIDSLTLHNATFRLVNYLLQHVPDDARGSPSIQLTTPKSIIASRLSIQPETFSRLLAKLTRHSLIEVHGSEITLCDIEGLRRQLHMAH